MLLIAPFVLYLAVARLGVRRLVIGAAPCAWLSSFRCSVYCFWYDQAYGSFEITTSTGAFLYSRVAAFAECSVDKPPADERWLCMSTPVKRRELASWYLWSPQSPLAHGPASEFSSQVNHLATGFAVRAIIAQPAAVSPGGLGRDCRDLPARAGYEQISGSVHVSRPPPQSLSAVAAKNGENVSYAFAYNGGANPNTEVVQPYAGWMQCLSA